ncbi:hypothetical protein BGZ61DRAFT_470021 [Ilyonectria robusta]|uniref:uncharacterized protein n=1 Tax=Ilyonectria robusta TaxID=1079257 RepID=UPI001E8E3CD7|nr:uncharacterized protein BGZ61DRAFT_470021 [Ilyonectria robusta]KAH8646437.1 hypothetical protein BGZ61DRAFT_470021 [Ilyonectria robusta]
METYPSYATAEGCFAKFDTTQEDSILDAFQTTQNPSWDPWWATDPSLFADSLGGQVTGPGVYGHDSFPPSDYASGDPLDYSDPGSKVNPVTEYSAPSLASEPLAPDASSVSSGNRRQSLAADEEPRKRKRRARQSTRSGACQDGDIDTPEAGTRQKSRRRSSSNLNSDSNGPDSPAQHGDGTSRRIKERNRVASNKFRVKKRADAKRLEVDEQDMDQINRDLTTCAADLTREVYELKMSLLQHTDCNCSLIQNYIANQAQRYIHGIEGPTPSHPS